MRRYQLVLIIIVIVVIFAVFIAVGYIPARASLKFGPPASHLSISQRIDYSARLLSHSDALSMPYNPNGIEQPFAISAGESAFSVANRLEQTGMIANAQVFLDYLVYTGLDLTLQSGNFKISPALSIIDIAHKLQDPTPGDITFVILPGWRMEEIAASLPTSGLDISPDDFLSSLAPPQILDLAPAALSMEGFFLPDSYILPRSTTKDQLLETIARNFSQHITEDMRAGYATQGLDIYQAVTLASIVEREAIQEDEQAMIASVFINRLNAGWALGSDPTVQYALGYDYSSQSWWKNPLTLDDLKFDSPYNTYVNLGLPPAPIANPSLEALSAVAFPASSPYFYFRAKCDDSGYHIFAVTLEEQIANGCE